MNILYLAHRIPFPPNKGDKLRAFRQLEFLSRRHRVWCACFIDDPQDAKHVAALRHCCHHVGTVRLHRAAATLRGLVGLTIGRTMTEEFYASARMKRLIRNWYGEVSFDAVVAFSSSMASYALAVPAARRVLDLCDLDSRKWHDYADASAPPIRHPYRTEARRLAIRERDWISRFTAATLITQRETELLPPECRSRVQVISNGVALPTMPTSAATPPSPNPVIGFLGQMDYKPNVDAALWFARQCLPAIRMRFPHAIFRIVGRRPTRAIRGLARLPGIEVTGEVADASAELIKFDISVAPLHIARGLQNKVLEAFAASKPVVTTSAVAESLEISAGQEALIADGAASFADAVVRLLRDPKLAARTGAAGHQFVIRHHQWEKELTRFEMLVTGESETVSTSRDGLTPAASRSVSGREAEVTKTARQRTLIPRH